MHFLLAAALPTVLIQGGTVIDGSGSPGGIRDLRIQADRILEIGKLKPRAGEIVVNAKGLVVAPGFIDAHSHADGGIEKEPTALSQITQGITTAVVGVDGIWPMPVAQYLAKLSAAKPTINFASFSGHGGIRSKILGENYKRKATQEELVRMAALVKADMSAGALGLSSGLEYDPGYYADTPELVFLAKVANEGLYISHMRDEGNKAFEAIAELRKIGADAKIRTQISHIKLCTSPVWNRAGDACAVLGKQTTADVYPYTFWQSSISALTPSREWEKRDIWVSALADVGGPKNVRLTNYSEKKAWVGKTLAEIAETEQRDPIEIIQEILREARGEGKKGEESVAVTAMTEQDLARFIRDPLIMFSSDGGLGGSHPRSAGSFPRVLGRYVRDQQTLSLPEAIRKMTSLPAATFQLKNRGLLRKGYIADITVFDPKTIKDTATASNPKSLSEGVRHVYVSGIRVLADGKATGKAGGKIVKRG